MPLEAENLSRVVEILQSLGKVYLSRDQYREAAGKFEDILRLGVKDTEVYRHLAVALAGQKLYTPEALRVYIWAVEKFPEDRNICLHVALAALHHNAEDEPAQRFYEAALKFHPPFAKDLYLHLHYIFHRQKKYDESFQTLKQALYLEKSGEDRLVTRLTELGWRYDRQQELIMTLQFLLGNNEENLTIRRCLAFSLAHAIIRHHCKQKPSEVNLPFGSEADLHILQITMPNPAALTGVDMVREYCMLQLALLAAPRPNKNSPSPSIVVPHNKNYTAVTPKAFEYRSLLEALPLEELLANSSLPAPAANSSTPTNSEHAAFDWQRDFLKLLPIAGKTTGNDAEPMTNDTEKSIRQTGPNALLILSPIFPHGQSDWREALPSSAEISIQKTIELVTQYLIPPDLSRQIYALSDGIIVFSSDLKELAQVTVELFKKIARYNVQVPEKNQIVLHAALHALSPARLLLLSPESDEEKNLAALELLYDGLHLLKAEREEPERKTPNPEPNKNQRPASDIYGRLLLGHDVFESALGSEHFTAKYWGPAYWGAPRWHDEICEVVWHNALEYASEKKPYMLGRFLVTEKFHEQRTYGTYRTRDRSLERPVVLKALHPEIYVRYRSDESQQAEMVNAIRRLGRLEHPGVALIYDMGTHEDIFYFVREHIEGENLLQALANQQRLSPAEAGRLLLEVCRILRYAHQNGFYHGNLKPSNIWRLKAAVMKEPTHVRALLAPPASSNEMINIGVKISDFFIPGFNEISETNWYYAAPELLFQNQVNHARTLRATADIYALGMILYDCLGGENPFRQMRFPVEPTSWEQAQLISLAGLNHNSTETSLLPALDEIIQRATHKNPFQRFQTVDEFETALRQVLREPLALIHKPTSLLVAGK